MTDSVCAICDWPAQTPTALASHMRRKHPSRLDGGELDLRILGATKDELVRCALYGRRSKGSDDVDIQLAEGARFAAKQGYCVVFKGADGREEDAHGDTPLWNRPQGSKLWNLMKSGGVDIVVIWDLSRLTREDPVDTVTLLRTIRKKLNVDVHSITEPFISPSYRTNPAAEEICGLLEYVTAMANHKRLKDIRKDTTRTLHAKRKAGIFLGRHGTGCGKDYKCPTGAHDENGASVRRPRDSPSKKNRPWLKAPPLQGTPPVAAEAAGGATPPPQEP